MQKCGQVKHKFPYTENCITIKHYNFENDLICNT